MSLLMSDPDDYSNSDVADLEFQEDLLECLALSSSHVITSTPIVSASASGRQKVNLAVAAKNQIERRIKSINHELRKRVSHFSMN